MIKFLVTQVRLGRITLEDILDNPALEKYHAAVQEAVEKA